jgi:SAM-dependent methyltransferase
MGIRSVLARPRVYEAWSRLVGGEKGRSTLVRDYVRPTPGERVLDLGCGPGELLAHLGEVDYTGVDISGEYIEQARRRYGGRGEFRVGDATELDEDLTGFDLVLAFGVVHHLDDRGAQRLFGAAATALAGGGRFVSVDPTLTSDERRPLARLLINGDRGGHVREPGEYERLATTTFPSTRCEVRKDLLRIPYAHCVLECQTGSGASPSS